MLTILLGGILLIVLDRAAPTEDLQTLLEQSRDPDALPRRAVATTALSAIVAVAFGERSAPKPASSPSSPSSRRSSRTSSGRTSRCGR
ncbi:hypothetical protein IOD13_06775 [Brevibacterium casei]|nr:hypothetical protein [Brevibacterium casei]